MDSVRVDRFYLGCLAHASYMITSGGVSAVIDPQRDVEIYLNAAADLNSRVEHVIETHLHADFVSGHRELAQRTEAKIYLGDNSGATFPHIPMRDGDSIQFGNCRLMFLQTPGHTIESVSILLDEPGKPDQPATVFTGDTLFIGDVGRPDLSANHTPQQLAELLFHSLHNKLLTLPDDTIVLPAHGAGSLCGRQMSSDASSTIGRERKFNYALQARNSDEFVHLLTDSLPPRPEYFARDVELNRRGADPLASLPRLKPLSAAEVLRRQGDGAVVIDTRPPMQFAVGHVPGSIHIALTGQYASWAARIIGLDSQVIITGEDEDHVRESQLRLARVGIENVVGYLEEGVSGWIRGGYRLDYIPQLTVQEFALLAAKEPLCVLDVREPGEINAGKIQNSIEIPLGQLSSRCHQLDPKHLLVVHCKGGYRSSIATSILRRAGFENIANLTGGFDAWQAAGMPVAHPQAS